MLDLILFIALPYVALTTLIVGSIWRFRTNRFSYSALSSQFLESRRLLWGSVPWHIGVLILFVGHLLPFLFPAAWQTLAAHRPILIAVESIGVAAALLAIAGLSVLFFRRLTDARLQRVTTAMDLVIVGILLTQVVTGLGVAMLHRWGARWSAGTLAPYLWELLTLRPDVARVAGLPPLVKIHLSGAWIIFLLLPFSRLVHVFSLPLQYLLRPPQIVLWASCRRREAEARATQRVAENRRVFLKGAFGLTAAGGLLTAGVLDKLYFFFRGPRMTHEQQADHLQKKLDRLNMTAEQRELELERMRSPRILVARLAELDPAQGKYFTDYHMRPGLAFIDADTGLPRLISAKCTHLGCTVASLVDNQGRVLCPCHVSYFDLKSGRPTAGSPAKAPLPILGWELIDAQGNVVARRRPGDSAPEGNPSPDELKTCGVYIVREFAAEEA
jgi:nitrate reductase gamma subunit